MIVVEMRPEQSEGRIGAESASFVFASHAVSLQKN